LASDNCGGCVGQGGMACWHHTTSYSLSCTSICETYGGCIAANWNDDTTCSIMKHFFSTTECAYSGWANSATPAYCDPSVCGSDLRYRGGAAQNCDASSYALKRICVCQY